LIAFDVPAYDGVDIREQPLRVRKAMPKKLLARSHRRSGVWHAGDHCGGTREERHRRGKSFGRIPELGGTSRPVSRSGLGGMLGLEIPEMFVEYSRLYDLTVVPVPEGDHIDQRYAETIIFGLPFQRKQPVEIAADTIVVA
jgi:hypothetical protein